MIAVAGGTGLLGTRLVAALIAQGQEVRVLTRDRARARPALGTTPEIVEVDVRRPDGLAEALEGVATVVSAFHGFLGGRGEGPDEVDRQGNANLVAAAQESGSAVRPDVDHGRVRGLSR